MGCVFLHDPFLFQMTVKEKIALIKSLDDQGIANRNLTAIDYLKTVYERLKGVTFSEGCGDCVRKAYGQLQLMLTNKTIMENSNFKLQEDALLPIGDFGTSEFLSNDNLTDERAYKALKRDPNLLSFFEEYPQDEEGNLLPQDEAPKAKAKKETVETKLDGTKVKTAKAGAGEETVHPITDDKALKDYFKLRGNNLDKFKADYVAKFNRPVPAELVSKADVYNAIYAEQAPEAEITTED